MSLTERLFETFVPKQKTDYLQINNKKILRKKTFDIIVVDYKIKAEKKCICMLLQLIDDGADL